VLGVLGFLVWGCGCVLCWFLGLVSFVGGWGGGVFFFVFLWCGGWFGCGLGEFGWFWWVGQSQNPSFSPLPPAFLSSPGDSSPSMKPDSCWSAPRDTPAFCIFFPLGFL